MIVRSEPFKHAQSLQSW